MLHLTPRTLVLLGLLLMTHPGLTQTIRDFFQPDKTKNRATYVLFGPRNTFARWVDPTGARSVVTNIIMYVGPRDTLFLTYEQRATEIATDRSMALYTNAMLNVYTHNSVQTKRLDQSNMALTGSNRSYYDISIKRLMMPTAGVPVRWTYNFLGEKWSCSASMTSLPYQGKSRKAIRLEKTCPSYPDKVIEYCVQGVGFFRRDLMNKQGQLRVDEMLSSLTWEPNAMLMYASYMMEVQSDLLGNLMEAPKTDPEEQRILDRLKGD